MLKKTVLCEKEFLRFLKTVNIDEGMELKQEHIGIVLMPWLTTPVPWYSMVMGLLLRNKGYKVSLIVNDMWLDCKYPVPYYKHIEQAKEIIKVIKRNVVIRKQFNVVYLSRCGKNILTIEDEEKLQKLAEIATVRQFTSSGMADTQEYKEATEIWKNIFREFYPNILSLLSSGYWEKLIIPGGSFVDSGLFLEVALKYGITAITYDSSPTSAFIGINGCASRNVNLKEAVVDLLEQGEGRKVYEKAMNILEMRKNGKNDIAPHMGREIVQKSEYRGRKTETGYDVVIFMNVEHDTAAIGTHQIFKNDLEWIRETVKYIVERTNLKVAIREHPLQRLFGETTLSSRIKELEIENRVCFFDYNANVNSYDLVEKAKVVLVGTSTIGLEALLCGKRVVLECECYYASLNGVGQAKTKEQYWDYILEAVSQPLCQEQAEKEEVAMYYYLTQMYGSIREGFSAQPNSFLAGMRCSFDELQEREDVSVQVDCIIEEKPLCLMLYQRDSASE